MARILLMDDDPIFAALLEDRLQVEGHQVEVGEPSFEALSAAAEKGLDGVILDLDLSGAGGLEVIQSFRSDAATKAIPILVLSAPLESSDRVAVYRAGADELLTRPADMEEVLLLLHRLLGRQGRDEVRPVLQGNLADHPLWELLQYIESAGKTGELVVRGRSSSGHLSIDKGQVVKAVWKPLQGAEALLAVLGLDDGTFRFQVLDKITASDGELLPTRKMLMESAWLEDELRKRKPHLPGTGVPLVVEGRSFEAPGAELESVPLREVHRLLAETPELRVYDLLSRVPAAPKKIRLAVASLIELGAIRPASKELDDYPSTTEIETGALLEVTVDEVLESARRSGFETATLPCLLLAEPGAWQDLRATFGRLPGSRRTEVLRRLDEQLELRGGGSAVLKGSSGKLSLGVQTLTEASRRQLEVIVPLCAGVILWLDDGVSLDLPRMIVEGLSKGQEGSVGILIAPSEQARNKAEWLIRGRKRWQTVPMPIQSLFGVLRLLEITKASR